jgi:hypothetical protein
LVVGASRGGVTLLDRLRGSASVRIEARILAALKLVKRIASDRGLVFETAK